MTLRSGIALAALAAATAVSSVPAARGGDVPAEGRERNTLAERRSVEKVAKEIDQAIVAAWKDQGLTPTPPCTDEDFVRRAYLDLVGTIPSAEQAEAFVKDQRFDKRAQLVDSLIASPGYSRHMADLWAEVLVGRGTTGKDADFAPGVFRPWLEKELAARRPYPELVRELLTATGTSFSNPAVSFFGRREFAANDMAGAVSQSFLGVRIQCAQCHDHPYEAISQADFHGMAAFFARMTLRPAEIPYEMFGPRLLDRIKDREEKQVQDLVKKGVPEEQARLQVRRQRPKTIEVGELSGDARLPRRFLESPQRLEKIGAENVRATPKFLKSVEYQDAAGETRRQALADWIANQANPYTARALANRYWAWLMGRGIVDPVDDFSSVNLPSVPAALDILTKDVAENGFDLDRLVRIVAATRAYQLSSATRSPSDKAQQFFAVGPLKQLTPQQTFDSLQVALGVVDDPTQMSDVAGAAPSAIEMDGGRFGQLGMMGDEQTRDRTRVLLTYAARSFFQTFQDDEGGGVEAFEGTIPQGLFLMNSQVVNGLLTNPQVSVVPELLKDFKDERARIRQLFLRTLSREPNEKEAARFLEFVRTAGPTAPAPDPKATAQAKRAPPPRRPEDQQAAPYADVLWALVSSSEFGTNH